MADFDFLDGFEEGGDWGFSSVAEKPSEKTQSDSKKITFLEQIKRPKNRPESIFFNEN